MGIKSGNLHYNTSYFYFIVLKKVIQMYMYMYLVIESTVNIDIIYNEANFVF